MIEIVNIRNVQTCRELLWIYLSQSDDNCWETKSQLLEKMLQRVAVLRLILYIAVTGGDTNRASVKSIGGRLKGWK